MIANPKERGDEDLGGGERRAGDGGQGGEGSVMWMGGECVG